MVMEMCQWLDSQDVAVDLVTTNADGDSVLDVTLNQPIMYENVNTIFFNRDFSESAKYAKGFGKWIKAHAKNYDLIHIHAVFSHLCIAAARQCSKHGIPYVVRPLGTLDPWSISQKPWRKQLFLKLGVKKLLTRASAIQYSTDMEKQVTESHLGLTNGVVIANGLNCEQYGPQLCPSLKDVGFTDLKSNAYILFLGRIAAKKNIELLLATFEDLNSAKGPNHFKLVIAGTGEKHYCDTIVSKVKQSETARDITYTGWVSGEQKKALLGHAALFVLPSKNENYGISVAESLASGVPVVVSDQVYLYPDIEQSQSGWVWRQQDALSDILNQALKSSDLKQRGINARNMVQQKFHWPVVSQSLKRLYLQLVKN